MAASKFRWLSWVLLLSLVGCSKLGLLRSQSGDDDDDDDEPAKKTMFIKDQVSIAGLLPIQIEGVGLVTNLDGTGGDPAPSLYRTLLLEDMRKRGVPNPNALLQSPSTTLVLVRAALPPVAQIGDPFDIEVVLPESSEATSLSGGWLMETHLAEQAIVPGRGSMKGYDLAKAEGPILISTGDVDEASRASVVKRGKVLGGGKYLGGQLHQPRALGLNMLDEFRSPRNTKRIADRIGKRFNYYDNGVKKSLAKAMTDYHIELKVHPRYKENYVRFVHVIRHIALRETATEEHDRMERLKKELMVPETTSNAALQLEAIGSPDAILMLKEGLKSPIAEVRFYCADALAYLGDGSGAHELVAAAENEEAFRVFALAALSILEDGETHELLAGLMSEYRPKKMGEDTVGLGPRLTTTGVARPEPPKLWPGETGEPIKHGAETRYGAFRALWTLDKNDPFIRGEKVNDQFNLHPLDTHGEPIVHLTKNRVSEVVVFGADQEFRVPMTVSAGRHIIVNALPGSDTVTISRFEPNKPDREVVVSKRVADVVRSIGELGASYPDVAQMLTQADRQSNLPGRLEIDALPQSGRIFHRPPRAGSASQMPTKVKVGSPSITPNIFPSIKPERPARGRTSAEDADAATGEASLVDASSTSGDKSKKTGRLAAIFKNPFAKKSD